MKYLRGTNILASYPGLLITKKQILEVEGLALWKFTSHFTTASQSQLTAQESTLTSVASERDKLVEDKSGLEEELAVMKSQIHEFQV